MTPLWLLRHGDTAALTASGAAMIIGQRDVPLSPAGWDMWRQRVLPDLKNIIASAGTVRIYASDLQRCALPAAELGAVHSDVRLREQSFGNWEGRTWADIPEARTVLADPLTMQPPGGESYQHVMARVRAWITTLEPEVPALVVGHAGSLRAVVAQFLGLPAERAQDVTWNHWGLSRIDRYAADRGVLAFHQRDVPGHQRDEPVTTVQRL